MSMKEIKLNAHAKLNLSLEVVGRREDGYHNIVSLMQGIGLCDVVTIKKCAKNGTKYNLPHCRMYQHDVYLCTDEKTIPTDMNNLALKGIRELLKWDDTRFPEADLFVEIDKRLPVAAGIAGGSGNAAVAMLGLNELMGCPWSLRDLMKIGAEVGADVPFSIFMNAYRNKDVLTGLEGIAEACDAAWITGIGDGVEPAEAVPRYVIMANPGIAVSTAEAYKAIDEIGYDDTNPNGKRKLFVNDLERYTLASYKEASILKEIMEDRLRADDVLMSGSGPTIAAYYKDRDKATEDARLLEELLSSDTKIRIWRTITGMTQEEAF